MALAAQLSEAGLTADSLHTDATVTLDKVEGGFVITTVHLKLVARIPGITPEAFASLTEKVKGDCPVSKVLNAKITLEVKLEA